jgi:hypothetical protein
MPAHALASSAAFDPFAPAPSAKAEPTLGSAPATSAFPATATAGARDLGHAQPWADGAAPGAKSIPMIVANMKTEYHRTVVTFVGGKNQGIPHDPEMVVVIGNGGEDACGVDFFTSTNVRVGDEMTEAKFEANIQSLQKYKMGRVDLSRKSEGLGRRIDMC